MRADFALLLLDMLPGASHAFTAETLGALRMVKDKAEYANLKMNAGIADRAMQKAFASIKPGMSELDLAAAIKDRFAEEGATPAFWIVGAGGNGAFPHHLPAAASSRRATRSSSTSAAARTASPPTSPAWRWSARRRKATSRSTRSSRRPCRRH